MTVIGITGGVGAGKSRILEILQKEYGAYVLFTTGYFYAKHVHVDIRSMGSGNIGTTNTFRTLGKKAGILVFLGDGFKGN